MLKINRPGILALIFVLLVSMTHGHHIQLSSRAEIAVITAGPGQLQLYLAFGHSAFRVVDPENGIDWVYNYGTFDYNQPNFYLNFARGYLNYKVSRYDYSNFRYEYIYFNRSIYEQLLNLNAQQKQALFDFLENNMLPENQYYLYDYFYDNCATRIRDAMDAVFGDQLIYDQSYIDTDYNFRELVDIYAVEQPWGDLGIDLCLGIPMDKKLEPYEYMFLPDYVYRSFAHAKLKTDSIEVPLVKRTITTYERVPSPSAASKITPDIAFWSIFAIIAGITFLGYKRNRYLKGIDITLFCSMGLFGWFLFLLWVATDHASSYNHNLLWAVPFHFPLAFFLLKKEVPGWLINFFKIILVILIVTLLLWYVWPQRLHHSLVPIILMLALRAGYIIKNN